jgi:hypothetical protein
MGDPQQDFRLMAPTAKRSPAVMSVSLELTRAQLSALIRLIHDSERTDDFFDRRADKQTTRVDLLAVLTHAIDQS